jgi:hypothetical protein
MWQYIFLNALSPQPSLARPESWNEKTKVWQNQWEENANLNWGNWIAPTDTILVRSFICCCFDCNLIVLTMFSWFVQALCKSYPSEFVTYFHYCRSLQFEDKPDYSYLKKNFRDLFIREGVKYFDSKLSCLSSYCSRGFFWILAGCQPDYVFDWTVSRQAADNNRLRVCLLLFWKLPVLLLARFAVLNVVCHSLPAEWEDRWVGGTICGSGWTSCRFVSGAYIEILHLGNKQGGSLEAQIFILSL